MNCKTSIILHQKTLLLLQSKVFDRKGRFHALGCWNHQHKRVHTKPWAVEAGIVASKHINLTCKIVKVVYMFNHSKKTGRLYWE